MQYNERTFPKEDNDSSEKRDEQHRREEQRRREESAGFAYISTVGWICRREKSRRKDDEFMF
jgi:hypothetical protein